MSPRRSARELALKVLFQVDVGGIPFEEVLETSIEQVRPEQREEAFIREVVPGAVRRIPELDAIIGSLAEGWSIGRLARVDKNVLRIALYELLYMPTHPVAGVINDAVEIAKTYSTEDSGRFVNGILGAFVRDRMPDASAGANAQAGN